MAPAAILKFPTGQSSDRPSDTSVREALEEAEADYVADRENRDLAKVDLEMIAGYQWDEEEERDREVNDRPTLTINRLLHPVKQVANDIKRATPSVNVRPTGAGASKQTAEIHAGLMRQVQRVSRAPWVYAAAAFHSAACGIGHFRFLNRYVDDDTFDQEVYVDLIRDPLAVLWDYGAQQTDRSDAEHCYVFEDVPTKAYEKRFKHPPPSDFAIGGASPGRGILSWSRPDSVTIAERWFFRPEEREIGQLSTGQVVDLTKITELPQGIEVVATRKVQGRCLYHVLMNGVEPISDETKWPGKWIPIVPVIGLEIPLEKKTYRQGVIRPAIDSQRMHNYWRSSSAEWIDQGPKSPFIATANQIGPHKDMWDEHNRTTRPYLLAAVDPDLPPGTLPRREPPAQPPQGFWEEGRFTAQEIKDGTGIQDAGFGKRSNEVSGVAIERRNLEGEMANFEIADNLEYSLYHAGRIMLDLFPRIYDTQRQVRILDAQEREKLAPINVVAYSDEHGPVLLNDLSVGRYEADIKIGPSMTTRREAVNAALSRYVETTPDLFFVFGDILIESSEAPGADKLAARMRRFIASKSPGLITEEEMANDPPIPPNPAQERAAALEEADQLSKIKYTDAKAAHQRAAAQREVVGAQADMRESDREDAEVILNHQDRARQQQPSGNG
jgi:portal protein